MKRRAYMKRSAIRRSQKRLRRSPLRRVSKRNWWEKLRPKMKKAFVRAGITTCELRYIGCWKDNGLGFAHSKRRRNIKTDAEKAEVLLVCSYCHDILDCGPESQTTNAVRLAIAARETPVILTNQPNPK